ncbi:BCCT family transporter [Streptomyces sp. ATMOS53]
MVAIILVVMFFVSGADANTYVLSMMTSNGSFTPRRPVLILRGVLTGVTAVVLMLAGGLNALQNTDIVTSLPFLLIIAGLAVSFWEELMEQLISLREILDRLPDPRRVRGRRYRLGSLLALCLLAVLGGATTLAGIARFAVDAAPETRSRIGLTRLPRATALGRLLSRIDGDAFDDAVGAWLARYSRDPVEDEAPALVGLAVDGKAVRGSRRDGRGRPSTARCTLLLSPPR